ncbi:MAG: prepilin-type N-terminal cleavage/methylation domain-containing protein [Lachnospiraceae bacterium]|nr:prepilin-type N-terminal cleavage/methylation domain-containing protein [Lachnospiraceae bacterium]
MRKDRKSNKGFSLVELIIVVGIIAVLVAVVAAGVLRYIEKSKIKKDVANGQAILSALSAAANEPEIYRDTITHASWSTDVAPGTDMSASYALHMGMLFTTAGQNIGKLPEFEYKKTQPTDWSMWVNAVDNHLECHVGIKTPTGTYEVAPNPEGPYAD